MAFATVFILFSGAAFYKRPPRANYLKIIFIAKGKSLLLLSVIMAVVWQYL